ncbi:MAG: hypothetical protein IT436_09880 [Phycisphaerales bacterium]|nr:hypothetical protein [Phycisphaerales bacterium]
MSAVATVIPGRSASVDAGSDGGGGILFTAFEPSGDDHASAVIAELRKRHPRLPIYAWGGPKMERAGATIIERTGDDAVMGLPGIEKIREHRRINRRIAAWLDSGRASMHVPVDSPAANFPICAMAKARGMKVVHLVAPQVWAWASWRVRKLRKRTDLVLCLLPFEEDWFRARNVPARFIGHPLFDADLDLADLDRRAAVLPAGGPRVALMPGSRPGELTKNFPILLRAYRLLQARHPGMVGVLAATRPEVERQLRAMAEGLGGWPESLSCLCGQTDVVVRWSELALVVSGTVTLQVAKQQRPMVIVYKSSRLVCFLLGSWLVSTRVFTLPNLIAGRRIVPELVPYFGQGDEVAAEAARLLDEPGAADQQRKGLAGVREKFRSVHAASSAADAIEQVAGLVRAG